MPAGSARIRIAVEQLLCRKDLENAKRLESYDTGSDGRCAFHASLKDLPHLFVFVGGIRQFFPKFATPFYDRAIMAATNCIR